MRYYSIEIDGKVAYTSHPKGPYGPVDPGALQVEIDIPVGPQHMPVGAAVVRIWGVDFKTIGQASDLNGKPIKVYGGMGVGLPLANVQAPNSGLLVQGQIYSAFGNWIANDVTLDLVIIPGTGNEPQPANLVVQHKAGDKLGDVVKQALTTAYPGKTINVNVSDRLILDHPGWGFYQSLEQFSDVVNRMSIGIFGAGSFMSNVSYPGIQIVGKGDMIDVGDGQKPAKGPKTIQFYDYIGQPTWMGPNTVQLKTIMRGDINIIDMVTFANTRTSTTTTSNPQLRDNSAFQGTFMVQHIRHVGNFRQPDGMSWNTTFDCVTADSPGSERGPGQTIGAPGTTPIGTVAGPN